MGRKLDALNAIAVEQGYTGDEPTSVVGAINAIVDAMGGDSSAVGIADAITAIAPYIGGGGVDVGPLVAVLVDFDEPTVGGGGNIGGADGPHTVAIGDTVIGSGIISGLGEGSLYGSFAAGMTAQTMSYETVDTLSAYACTIGDDGESGAVYQTVAPYTLDAIRTSDAGGYSWTFVIPEMDEGVALVLYPHMAD